MTLPPVIAKMWNNYERRNGYIPSRTFNPRKQQRGGGSYTAIVEGHPITIMETQEEPNTILFYGSPSQRRPACFTLKLEPMERLATLDDLKMPVLSGSPACFDDGHQDARKIVRLAYWLARHRDYPLLQFTDNSTKHCSESGYERLRLADFYRLITGQTWYEQILLQAGALSVRMEDPTQSNVTLEADKMRAATVSWDTMSDNGALLAPSLPIGINTATTGSARIVLKHLRDLKSLEVCQFLANNLAAFLFNSRITPVFGTRWVCEIGIQPSRSSNRHVTTRRRTRRRRHALQ